MRWSISQMDTTFISAQLSSERFTSSFAAFILHLLLSPLNSNLSDKGDKYGCRSAWHVDAFKQLLQNVNTHYRDTESQRRIGHSALVLEPAGGDGSEDKAADVRQVGYATSLGVRDSACMEELNDKPETD